MSIKERENTIQVGMALLDNITKQLDYKKSEMEAVVLTLLENMKGRVLTALFVVILLTLSLSLGLGFHRVGPTGVLLQGRLHLIEQRLANQRLMQSWIQLFSVSDLSSVERVVKDSSHRCGSEQSRSSPKLSGRIGKRLRVAGAKSFIV